MSDYYGSATLEDWLAEEQFGVAQVPQCVVELFEQWREQIENSIEDWQVSGIGWRQWGRAFPHLDHEETALWFDADQKARELIKELPMANVKQGDRFFDRTGRYLMATSDAEHAAVDYHRPGDTRWEVWVMVVSEPDSEPFQIWEYDSGFTVPHRFHVFPRGTEKPT